MTLVAIVAAVLVRVIRHDPEDVPVTRLVGCLNGIRARPGVSLSLAQVDGPGRAQHASQGIELYIGRAHALRVIDVHREGDRFACRGARLRDRDARGIHRGSHAVVVVHELEVEHAEVAGVGVIRVVVAVLVGGHVVVHVGDLDPEQTIRAKVWPHADVADPVAIRALPSAVGMAADIRLNRVTRLGNQEPHILDAAVVTSDKDIVRGSVRGRIGIAPDHLRILGACLEVQVRRVLLGFTLRGVRHREGKRGGAGIAVSVVLLGVRGVRGARVVGHRDGSRPPLAGGARCGDEDRARPRAVAVVGEVGGRPRVRGVEVHRDGLDAVGGRHRDGEPHARAGLNLRICRRASGVLEVDGKEAVGAGDVIELDVSRREVTLWPHIALVRDQALVARVVKRPDVVELVLAHGHAGNHRERALEHARLRLRESHVWQTPILKNHARVGAGRHAKVIVGLDSARHRVAHRCTLGRDLYGVHKHDGRRGVRVFRDDGEVASRKVTIEVVAVVGALVVRDVDVWRGGTRNGEVDEDVAHVPVSAHGSLVHVRGAREGAVAIWVGDGHHLVRVATVNRRQVDAHGDNVVTLAG